MALTHLVYTSVLKRLGRPQVRAVLEPMVQTGQLARPRIVDLEVSYSARNGAEWNRLLAAMDQFGLVETTDVIATVTGQTCRWIVPAGTVD